MSETLAPKPTKTWVDVAASFGKKLAVIVAIVSGLTAVSSAAWSLIELAKETRERSKVARIAQLTTYASFGKFLERYHVIEQRTDDFMRRDRQQRLDRDELLRRYQTGASIYYSEELREFREIHQFYEELATLIRFGEVDFDLVFQLITFPSDFTDATRELQSFLRDHWFEMDKDPKKRRLCDFGANLDQLEKNYNLKRANTRKTDFVWISDGC
jgi:hypothetical protein